MCSHQLIERSVDTNTAVVSLLVLLTTPNYCSCIIPTVGYVTATLIVERFSGIKLQDFFRKYIFDPLGMKASTLNFQDPHVNASIAEGFATVTRNATGGEGWSKTVYEAVPYFFDGAGDAWLGTGGVISNANEMVSPGLACPHIESISLGDRQRGCKLCC